MSFTKKYSRWSLVSKLTFWGFLLTAISLPLSIYGVAVDVATYFNVLSLKEQSNKQGKPPIMEVHALSSAIWDGNWNGGVRGIVRADFDNDTFMEEVHVGPNTPNSIVLTIYDNERGALFSQHIYKNSEDYFDEFGDPKLGVYFHVVALDVTKDGVAEILVSFYGDIDGKLFVFQYQNNMEEIFTKNQNLSPMKLVFSTSLATVVGDTPSRIRGDGTIDINYGSQGLFERYRWDGNKFKSLPPGSY